MKYLKQFFFRLISIGIHSKLSEEKKLAIQISTLDGYWSLIAISFYIIDAVSKNLYPLYHLHIMSLIITLLGIWFIKKHWYDIARPLIHIIGLIQIFITGDCAGVYSGYEFYYFTSIAIPFITFTYQEQWKGNILTALACLTFLFQLRFGTGHLGIVWETNEKDKFIALLFVMSYFLLIFTFARWQLKNIQRDISKQYDELVHSSKMVALGEMSSGIAHEINNPLQSLSLNLSIVKEKFTWGDDLELLSKMERTIQNMGKLVQGLKDLSKKDLTGTEMVTFSKLVDDVLTISADKLRDQNITIFVNGDTSAKIEAHPVQISQVLLNLILNSVDAVKDHQVRWIRIEYWKKNSFLQVSVTDSGKGISKEIVHRIMEPFFTTKRNEKGTGLGLSISKSIIEKNNGKIYYDTSSVNTRFIILLPLAMLEEISDE